MRTGEILRVWGGLLLDSGFWYLKLVRLVGFFMGRRGAELDPPHGLTAAARGAGATYG